MKKLYLVFCFASLVLLNACQEGNGKSKEKEPTKSTSIAPSNGSLPIACVNLDTLKLYHKLYEELETRIKSEQRKAERQLSSKEQQYRKEVDNFKRRVQGGLVSDKEIQEKGLAFQKKEQELMMQQRALSQGLAATEQELIQEWFDTISTYMEEYNKDKGYQVVLPYQAGTFLYMNNALDITEEVLEGLNEKYDADEKAGSSEEKKESK